MQYKTENIYFGNVMYDAGKDGFYHSGPHAFYQEKSAEGVVYSRIDKKDNMSFKVFTKDNKEYLSVSNLVSITSVMDDDKVQPYMSEKKVNLYLLKYKLSKIFTKNNISENSKTK